MQVFLMIIMITWKPFLKKGMLLKPSSGGLLKKYLAETVAGQEVPYVFPMCYMRWQPHSGQMQISTFQTAFSNSAMESPVYLAWKR